MLTKSQKRVLVDTYIFTLAIDLLFFSRTLPLKNKILHYILILLLSPAFVSLQTVKKKNPRKLSPFYDISTIFNVKTRWRSYRESILYNVYMWYIWTLSPCVTMKMKVYWKFIAWERSWNLLFIFDHYSVPLEQGWE